MILVAITAAMVMAAAGCTGPPAPQGGTISIREFEFSFSVLTMTVPLNQVLTLSVTNNGTMQHTFTIDAPYSINETLDPNETATIHLVPTTPGSFEYYCSMPGHEAAGMVGTIQVKHRN